MRARVAVGSVVAFLACAGRARAQGAPPAVEALPEPAPTPTRTEVGAFPLVGGDSDNGVALGELSSITHYDPGFHPYRWRVEDGAVITFKEGKNPFQNYYATIIFPDLVPGRLRVQLDPSYTREETLRYYGLGNAAPFTSSLSSLEYGRTHPTMWARVFLYFTRNVYLSSGASFTYDVLDIPSTSRLAHDMSSGSPEVKSLLGTGREHGVFLFENALAFDTRDDEINPTYGTWDAVTLRASPGGTDALPYKYGDLDVTLRGYVTPVPRRVTLAMRVVTDVLFGDPPFYELERVGDTPALGGVNGVRGIPAGRYYGRIKMFTNLEVRTELVRVRVFGKPITLGPAAFVDAGRVWSDFGAHPELDGTGLGVKWGAGGGVRVRQGESFVVRADVAWSPDAEPIALYFTAGQMF